MTMSLCSCLLEPMSRVELGGFLDRPGLCSFACWSLPFFFIQHDHKLRVRRATPASMEGFPGA